MSEIQQILTDLNEVSGVMGCALLTNDGIMVASVLGKGFLDDVVAGLSSFLISTTRRSLDEAGMGGFNRFIMHSTHGKVILVDAGDAVLVVMTDQFVELPTCLESVQKAAVELRRVARIQL